jgi:TolA-binding protein
VYPQAEVATLIEKNFIPARVHVREQPEDFQRFGERYGAQWTPTILELDPDGREQHRIEGFLEADAFLAQLELGLAKIAFSAKRWQDAERRFRDIVDRHSQTDAAAEALYWAGVSRYKASGEASALADTAAAFSTRYQNSPWATKASVWKA